MLKSLRIKLFSLFLVLFFVGNANATDINVTATVLTQVTVTEGTALNFGSFVVGATGGDITFDAGTAITAVADILLLGGEVGGIAELDTSALAGETITVTVTGTTLTGAGTPMTLVGNCQGNGGALGADNGDCTFTSQNIAVDPVDIGGVLTVNGAQAAGVYTGILDVVANF